MSLALPAVVVGTRRSPLARLQTARVIGLLEAAWPGLECDERALVTEGDRSQQSGRPLPEIGGKGLFTSELERGLRDGDLDLAVHSLKDLPTEDASGVVIGAVCLREDVRDCLVSRDGAELSQLRSGAVVGTSSLRRSAQLHALRPDVETRSIRGNVDTRIRKVRNAEFDGAILAAAGILRLGLEEEVAEWIAPETMVPAPGQGALAVQCRAEDDRALELLAAIDDPKARAATTAERAFLRALGGGCAAPVAAHAECLTGSADNASNSRLQGPSRVRLDGMVLSPDGRQVVRVSGEGKPEEIGERVAREALAAGADRILGVVRG